MDQQRHGEDGGGMPTPARCSDAEREGAVQRLCDATGEGRLTLGEFSARVEQAEAARTVVDLEGLVHDLPAGPPPAQRAATGRVLRFIGSLRREGRWRLPAISTYALAVGNVTLDLRQAEFGVPQPIIEVDRLVGNVHVIVPPDVEVEVSGAGVIGSMTQTGPTRDRAGPRPRLRLRGRALVGNVHVERRT